MSSLRGRTGFSLIAVLGLLAALSTLVASPAYAADQDCGDFGSQQEAQTFFLNQGGPQQDPHQLDADGDGIACEGNPCPCSTGTGGAGGDAGVTLRQRARVVEVVDGDTVRVRLRSGGREDVRMIGIDTPEVYGGVECGGPEASRSLKRMLPTGQRVRLVSDPTQDRRDRYGRILRYVVKPSGLDTNRRQVAKGWARVYVYDNTPFKRVRAYRAARDDAKAAGRGIWGLC